MKAFEAVIIKGGGLADVARDIAVLALFAVLFHVFGACSFDPEKRRTT